MRNVPKNAAIYAQIGSHALASADSRNTPKNSVFSYDAHRRHVVRTGLAIAADTVFLERAVAEQRNILYNPAEELRATSTKLP